MSCRNPRIQCALSRINAPLRRRLRSTLALALIALILSAPFNLSVAAVINNQSPAGSESQPDGLHRYIIRAVDGKVSCSAATFEELPIEIVAPQGPREQIKVTSAPQSQSLTITTTGGDRVTTQGTSNVGSGGLTINLNVLSQLQNASNKAQVIASFQAAAQYWTNRIKSPVTVDIDIDYGPNVPGSNPPKPFDQDVLGATGSESVTVDYPGLRNNLIAAANPSEAALYNSLPAASLPTNVGNGSAVEVNSSVAKALGIPTAPGSIAIIGFNSKFTFDFDQSNGISSGATDFTAVATHEIGHALGFSSNAGVGATATPTVWDLFRFRTGTTAGTFPTAPRILSIGGGAQVYYTGQTFTLAGVGTTELGLSTGGPEGANTDGGDGNQSSHWKADDITGTFIGIMDPTIGPGQREVPTENDYSTLETIGWDLTGNAIIPGPPPAPPTPPNDSFANAQVLTGCSGSMTGTNVGATKEPTEPNNPNSPTSIRSVWYSWQAPSTGSVTIDTRGSVFDTVLAVWTGSNLGGLSLIANNDDIDGSQKIYTSSVTFNATQGTIYRISVGGYNNNGSGGDFGNIKLNWAQSGCTSTPTVSFSTTNGQFFENDPLGYAAIVVTRSNTTAAASVDYATSDTSGLTPCQTNTNGIASDRCDYATAVGTLRFAAGEQSKTIQIPLINDIYFEPAENFTLTLRNPQGMTIAGPSSMTITIVNDDTGQVIANPIDNQGFFIKEQYIDFLGRVVEPDGFNFWNNRMSGVPGYCQPGELCDRIDTSKRFFESDEFQERGFYVYKLYDVSLGRFPLYSEFVPEVARLNGPQTVQEQRLGKDAYLLDFMNKTEFKNLYDQYLSTDHLRATNPTGFVNALCAKAGITPASKQTLIDNLANGARDPAHTLEDFILTPEISNAGTRFYDRARIVMQYFGYLRRDPERGTNSQGNPVGFDFWWDQLTNPARGHLQDYRFMVGGFLQSDEYRFRFAQ